MATSPYAAVAFFSGHFGVGDNGQSGDTRVDVLARLEAIAAEVRRLLSDLRRMATSNGEIREADAGYLTLTGESSPNVSMWL